MCAARQDLLKTDPPMWSFPIDCVVIAIELELCIGFIDATQLWVSIKDAAGLLAMASGSGIKPMLHLDL